MEVEANPSSPPDQDTNDLDGEEAIGSQIVVQTVRVTETNRTNRPIDRTAIAARNSSGIKTSPVAIMGRKVILRLSAGVRILS